MKKRMTFKGTTNPEFKYMIGEQTSDWRISSRIWFDDFHTSLIERIEYTTDFETAIQQLEVHTLYSVYNFELEV